MNLQSLVTVIIPTFNRETKLQDAIESVLAQTYPHVQLIVVDDGSTDGTKEFIKKYPAIEYYYKENGGQASARNEGLRNAKGTIIASLDSDDIWYPDFLKVCVEKLEQAQLDFVFANWDQQAKVGADWDFLINDPFLKPYFKKCNNNWIDLDYKEVRDLFLRACPSPSSSVVMRKSSIAKGWDEEINIGDDWCMYLEMILSRQCKVSFTLERLWHKRIDAINIYDGRKRNEVLRFLFITDTKRILEKFEKQLSESEKEILEKRYIASLVELAKHELIREFNIPESFSLLKKSLAVDVPFTLKMIPGIFMQGLKRKLNITDKTEKDPKQSEI